MRSSDGDKARGGGGGGTRGPIRETNERVRNEMCICLCRSWVLREPVAKRSEEKPGKKRDELLRSRGFAGYMSDVERGV